MKLKKQRPRSKGAVESVKKKILAGGGDAGKYAKTENVMY
jgi:hypothetical protein